MDRAELEAIYDSGRERCVGFMVELVASVERLTAASELLEERLRRLEDQARRDSRTSSKPPSQDPPKTRQQRRAEARAKAKDLLAKKDGVKLSLALRRGIGARDGRSCLRIRSMRSSSTGRVRVVVAGASSPRVSSGWVDDSAATRWLSCRRSACC